MCSGSNIALGVQAAGGLASTFAGYRKSQGEQQGYEYQANVARNNALIAEWQAQDALERGKVAEGTVRMKGANLRARQEATIAGRGIAINEGSALNILAGTDFMTDLDARTTADNSAKEAWALRNQSANYSSNATFLQDRANATSPLFDAASTLLTTGGKVAASWYSLKNKNSYANGSNNDGRDW